MTNPLRGIAVAGNIVADTVKTIPSYPRPGMLAAIEAVHRSVGGCVPNTGLSLAGMGGDIPLFAFGRVGDDEAGRYILRHLRDGGVNADGVLISRTSATSFSDAMFARDSGERTFFHHRGANDEFCPDDLPIQSLSCRVFHIGYALLLREFDKPDAAHGTVLARTLAALRSRGIRTSIDVVSDTSARCRQIVTPALRHCDYVIINEIEACAVAGLPPRDASGVLHRENIIRALEMIMSLGVRERAVLHCPEAGFCMDARTGLAVAPSFALPEGWIKGSVGAGDAFCAGCLRAIYEERDAEAMLRLGAASAAAALSAADSISGMRPLSTLEGWMSSGHVMPSPVTD